ncbi:MAG: hypothetical protein IKA36_00715 [Clostridia bacterium]|nr:hypothetical protein [Clostridia bacterium]
MNKKAIALTTAGVVGVAGVGVGGGVALKSGLDANEKEINALINAQYHLQQTLGDSTAYSVNNVNYVITSKDGLSYELSADGVMNKKGNKEEVDLIVSGTLSEDKYSVNVNNALQDYKNKPSVKKLTKYIQHVTKMVKNSTDIKVEESKIEIIDSKVPAGKIVDMALSSCLEENGMLSEAYRNMYKECSETTIEEISKLSVQLVRAPEVKADGNIEGNYSYLVNAYALVGEKVCSVQFTISNDKKLDNNFLVAYVNGLLTTKNAEISLADPKDDTVEIAMAKSLYGKDDVSKDELESFKANYSDVKYSKEYVYEEVNVSELAFTEANAKCAEFEATQEANI